jgi:hypothetical protein
MTTLCTIQSSSGNTRTAPISKVSKYMTPNCVETRYSTPGITKAMAVDYANTDTLAA